MQRAMRRRDTTATTRLPCRSLARQDSLAQGGLAARGQNGHALQDTTVQAGLFH